MEAFKIVVVPFGESIGSGVVREVHSRRNESLINGGRQAYAKPGVNVVLQSATIDELYAYGNGGVVEATEDDRTVCGIAGGRCYRNDVNELQDERFGF